MANPNLTPLEDALEHLLSKAPVVAQTETVALADAWAGYLQKTTMFQRTFRRRTTVPWTATPCASRT